MQYLSIAAFSHKSLVNAPIPFKGVKQRWDSQITHPLNLRSLPFFDVFLPQPFMCHNLTRQRHPIKLISQRETSKLKRTQGVLLPLGPVSHSEDPVSGQLLQGPVTLAEPLRL